MVGETGVPGENIDQFYRADV